MARDTRYARSLRARAARARTCMRMRRPDMRRMMMDLRQRAMRVLGCRFMLCMCRRCGTMMMGVCVRPDLIDMCDGDASRCARASCYVRQLRARMLMVMYDDDDDVAPVIRRICDKSDRPRIGADRLLRAAGYAVRRLRRQLRIYAVRP